MSAAEDRGQTPNRRPDTDPEGRSGSDPELGFPAAALRISSGVMVWAVHFAAIYGYTALACARGFGASTPWIVGAATVIAATAATLIIVRNLSAQFVRWLSAAIAGFALLAIVFEGITLLLVEPCA